MNMDATDLKNTMAVSDSASRTKNSRKGKIKSNVNRVNHRFNSKNSEPSSLENSIMNSEENKGKTDKDLEFILNSLQSNLESLTLSAAIAVKHARDTRFRLSASPSIPSLARISFAINRLQKV